MSKLKRKLDMGQEKQLSIFDIIEEVEARKDQGPMPGSLNLQQRIKEALSQALKNAPCKRWEVAGRMSEYTGVEITESMLNAWTAESKESHRFPMEYGPAFCWATGDYTIAELFSKACGGSFIKSEEVILLELARIEEAKRQLLEQEEQARQYLSKMRRAVLL
ncbi:hypothetical protein SCACP_30510 [Sporomusa carbonis]|uniref:hypothetical protein n=1 Tax=Sporomusa carbonis TaxID=3076075 RepID=UPI003A64ECE7